MSNKSKTIFLVVIAVVVFLIWFFVTSDSKIELNSNRSASNDSINTSDEIMITEDTKHSVPLDEIVGGGPVKDGIPSIDNPDFIAIEKAEEFLGDQEMGIAYSNNSTARFYPFLILAWHEIVNDTVDGQRILVTYCPLCFSGIVFDPLVDGERVEFGVSGKLWNSNLVMYDRKTDSLWSQVLGEAIVGEMTGNELEVLSFDQMEFGNWKSIHPSGEVLSKNTGADRFYGQDPYGDYYTTPGIYFTVSNEDTRLEKKDFVLGIVIDGKAKAYLPSAVKEVGLLEEQFAGKTIVVEYQEDLDVVRIFEKKSDNTLERINPFATFWFAWAAVHPGTEVYK